MKTVMQTLAAAVLAVAIPLISSAAEYRWLSSWDNSYPAIPYVVDPFIKGIETASKGSITIVRNGPETVPPFEQLWP